MHSDELSRAVTRIVRLLNQSGIRTAIDKYRLSKGDERKAAETRLGHVGAFLVKNIRSMSPAEQKVMNCLHLGQLGSVDYWKSFVAPDASPAELQGEVVRLASRVIFASSHLPSMMSLLDNTQSAPPLTQPPVSDTSNPLLKPLEAGEGALFLRLTDAGERASDPDRIARAIDGVDMLYSACASIARKPAIDLRLDSIVSKRNNDRDFRFTGDRDSISAVYAVIDSIPDALAGIDPEHDIDLDLVVRALPIFKDLDTLASLGTFSGNDIKDISETMHQGALLTLESGVILVSEDMIAQGLSATSGNLSDGAVNEGTGFSGRSAAESDEHYNRYLREREAMTRSQASVDGDSVNGHASLNLSSPMSREQPAEEERTRKEAVDELLKSLQQPRPT